MFNTLQDFYRSRDWEAFVRTLRLERTDPTTGLVLCEHCGRPIVKAYDCIAHHKTALTPENVNDVTVSLNPDNIALVHHGCHNEIHARFGYSRQEVYIVYGPPFAGKAAFVESVRQPGDLIVDIDSIWQAVSGCPRFEKPNALRSVVFGIYDALIDAVKYRKGRWQNAYIVGGFPFEADRERLLRDLDAREVFLPATRDECLARLAQDGRDKKTWTAYIETWFERHDASAPTAET